MRFTLLLLCLALPVLSYSQEDENEGHSHSSEEHVFRHHKIGIIIGHSHISQGFVDEGRKWRVLPSWEFAYSYSFNEKWFLSANVHLILEDFEVEQLGNHGGSDEGIILREKPVAPAISGGYRITKHSSIMVGAGAEFASGETFFLTRINYEWATHINEKWEISIPLTWDLRWNAYDVLDIGIGVVRMF